MITPKKIRKIMITPKKLIGLWSLIVFASMIVNAAILTGVVWLIVKVLRYMQVF
jgi:hypothetical protein